MDLVLLLLRISIVKLKKIQKKKFKKKYGKLDEKIKNKLKNKLETFVLDKLDRSLNIHKLHGFSPDRYSMSITGDYRVQFEILDNDTFLIVDIGTHSELY